MMNLQLQEISAAVGASEAGSSSDDRSGLFVFTLKRMAMGKTILLLTREGEEEEKKEEDEEAT